MSRAAWLIPLLVASACSRPSVHSEVRSPPAAEPAGSEAERTLAAALSRAAAEGKRVLVHVSSPG